MQITAEQLVMEANSSKEAEIKVPQQKIQDLDELNDYRMRKRKQFEDTIRYNRNSMGNWIKYAAWEESQKELTR